MNKTPEYILRAHRNYVNKRYATDESFREKVKLQRDNWLQKLQEHPEHYSEFLERNRESSRNYRLNKKKSELDAAMNIEYITSICKKVEEEINTENVLSALQGCLNKVVSFDSKVATVGEHMISGSKRKALTVINLGLYYVMREHIRTHDKGKEIFDMSVPTLISGLKQIKELLSYENIQSPKYEVVVSTKEGQQTLVDVPQSMYQAVEDFTRQLLNRPETVTNMSSITISVK